ETTKLTNYEEATGSACISPDCDRVAFSTNETDDKSNTDVYVATLENIDELQGTDGNNYLNARNLEIGEIGAEASPSDWGPDGEQILIQDNTEDLERAGIYTLDTDEIQWYGNDEFSESPVSFLPNGDRFLATRYREAVTVPIIYDVESGESRELDLPDGVSAFAWAGESIVSERQVLIQHTTPTRRTELLLYDLNSDEYEVLKEAEYGPFDPDEDFADATYFTFSSDGIPETTAHAVDHDPYDELEIGGLLYDCGEHPSPLIVNPHGGPPARDTKSFDLYTQTLIQRGYSVLKVNYRGSSGRGREFLRRLYDDWGGAEQGDVATGLEYVIENNDWIDENRIVVFGGSYGGYSAYWQMVQYPELYDAGIAWIGVSDLPDMYENTMPHFKTELMEKYLGKPEENPDLYEERSPSTHANNVAAPLLIVHGVNDRRVPISQARIFRDELEQAGYREGEDGDFEYHELGEEGHASSDQRKKLRMFRILDDFLQRRVPPESDKSTQK
ncbi:MAG: prolyl oligopeptidase family serine peptidase, partial [Halobacteriaceae archaeon]